MRGIVQRAYGAPTEMLAPAEANGPMAGDGEVLVRVRVSSANPGTDTSFAASRMRAMTRRDLGCCRNRLTRTPDERLRPDESGTVSVWPRSSRQGRMLP